MRTSTFVLCLLIAACARGQELQVPLDSAGTVQVIDAETARRLQLFNDYENFHEARLYQTADSSFVLEITYQPQEQVLKKREPMTAEEAGAFRMDVTRRMRIHMPYGMPDQDGRAKFLVGTTLIGLSYYGWAVPAMTQVQDAKGAVALYMLVAGSSFLVPLLITDHTPMNRAEAAAALYGGWRGIPHGVLAYALLAGDGATDKGAVASGMIGSIGEMIAGYQWAQHSRLTPGTVSAVAACGDMGMVFGAAGGLLMIGDGSDDNEPGFAENNDRAFEGQVRTFSVATLAGAAGGVVLGKTLADRQVYSKGDGYVLRELGILGIAAGISIADIADMNGQGSEAMVMVGSAGGILLGHKLTRPVNFSASQGTLIGLGELGGALFGLGVAVLVDADNSAPYITLATIGGAAGFGLGYHAFARSSQARAHSYLDLQISPAGLMAHDHVVPGIGASIRF